VGYDKWKAGPLALQKTVSCPAFFTGYPCGLRREMAFSGAVYIAIIVTDTQLPDHHRWDETSIKFHEVPQVLMEDLVILAVNRW